MTRVVNLKDANPDILTPLIAKYRYTPYWYIPGIREESRRALLRHQLEGSWGKETTCVLGAMIDSSLVGFLYMNRLDWDSDHFGFDVTRLNHVVVDHTRANPGVVFEALLSAAKTELVKRNVATVHTRVPLDEILLIQYLERFGFRIMDVQVTYYFDLRKQSIVDLEDRCVIRGYRESDKEVFVELARTAYTLDRFHSDPHLDKGRSDELHAQWIKNSCEGRIADYVVVAEMDGKPVGYATCVYHGDHEGLLNLRIGGMVLAAVAPQARRRGCHTSMLNGRLKWFKDKADVVYIGTQANNYPALRAYVHLGLRPVQASASLHLWLRD